MAQSGHSWKQPVIVMASTGVEMVAIGPVGTALAADQARGSAESGLAALQTLSARHLLVVHKQIVKDL